MKKISGSAKGVMIAISVAFAITLFVSMAVSYLIAMDKLAENTTSLMKTITWIICGLTAGIIAGKNAKEKIAIHIAVASSLYLLLLLAMNVILFNGIKGNILLLCMACLAGTTMLSCAICIRKGKKKRKHKI